MTKTKQSWQPIETAPKDGSAFLILDMNGGAPVAEIAHWNDGWLACTPDCWESLTREQGMQFLGFWEKPTHWMPLPPPPPKDPQS